MAGMQFKDYYAIMGVKPDATASDIKAAYKKLVRLHHPDVSKDKDALKRFTDLGEAYEALGDPEKRKIYDEVRNGGWREGQEYAAPRRARSTGNRSSHNRAGDGSFTGDEEELQDFFSSLFGSRRRDQPRHWQGEDIHHVMSLTIEEVYAGGERDLHMQVPGDGGSTERVLHVKIPQGLTKGEHIRLRGQGQPGSTPDSNGNLYLEIAVQPHPFYHLEGRDIRMELPLTPWEAVLGAQVPVPTLGGVTTVTIPPLASDGQQLRLRGRGLSGKVAGDQYLTLRITVPGTASERAKDLWRELAAVSAYNPRAALAV